MSPSEYRNPTTSSTDFSAHCLSPLEQDSLTVSLLFISSVAARLAQSSRRPTFSISLFLLMFFFPLWPIKSEIVHVKAFRESGTTILCRGEIIGRWHRFE